MDPLSYNNTLSTLPIAPEVDDFEGYLSRKRSVPQVQMPNPGAPRVQSQQAPFLLPPPFPVENHFVQMPLHQLQPPMNGMYFAQPAYTHQPRARAGSEEQRYECNECNKSFKRKSWLKRHALVHSTLKMHHCPYCTSRHKRKDNLNQHIKVKHNGGVPLHIRQPDQPMRQDAQWER